MHAVVVFGLRLDLLLDKSILKIECYSFIINLIFAIFRTFMSECERKRNDRGKLEFQRNLQNQSFQRACFILHDIKYLLNTAPDDQVCKTGWTNELRKGFLHGLSNLMDILSWMQGK